MIGARWANAEGGGFRWNSHPAYVQSENETTVTKASETLKVGERGIQYAKLVISRLLTPAAPGRKVPTCIGTKRATTPDERNRRPDHQPAQWRPARGYKVS